MILIACRISFNFIVNDNPLYVALHFKTHFGASIPADKAVVLNSKNVVWEEEHHHENSWQVGNSSEFIIMYLVFVYCIDTFHFIDEFYDCRRI